MPYSLAIDARICYITDSAPVEPILHGAAVKRGAYADEQLPDDRDPDTDTPADNRLYRAV